MNKQKELNARLEEAAILGNMAMLAQALEGGADARSGDSSALSSAANGGHVECVRFLIPVSDPMAIESRALRWAASNGHAECVRLLIPVSDHSARGSYALQRAARRGWAEIVKLLIPVGNPSSSYSLALSLAAAEGHAECVALLLPLSDPFSTPLAGFNAVDLARENGHVDVAGMIEAFIENKALSSVLEGAGAKPAVKHSL